MALLALCLCLSGCRPVIPADAERVSVYCTFYPIYALADAVTSGAPGIDLHCLAQPQDGCLRDYELSDWDARLLTSARAVIMGGRGLESFEGMLFGLGESGPSMVAALYNLELYNPSATSHAETDAESHFSGPNPHLYMSIDGAGEMIESIAASMLELDPDYAQVYADNVQRAAEQLEALREETREIVGDAAGQRVILMNEVLAYVARDYGLSVADTIERESGVVLADEELAKCLKRLEGTDARVILLEAQAPQRFVAALTQAGFSVARIDILSTHREGEGFNTYLEAQRSNARALRAALDAQRVKD